MVVYGYLRISTHEQNIEINRNDIIKKCKELFENPDEIVFIEEVQSGAKSWEKRKLGEMFKNMYKNDKIITSEISRIGRSIMDVMSFCKACNEKGVEIYCIKTDFKIDNSTQSQMLLFAYSLSAQIERELISSRTKTALKELRDKGLLLGRPHKSKLDKHKNEIEQQLRLGVTQIKLAQKYKCNKGTMCAYVKKHFRKYYDINDAQKKV